MSETYRGYGFVYLTTNKVNRKKYIGKRHFDKRNTWRTYLGSGVALKSAIKKYGRENFEKIIIDYAASEQELNEKERYWIAFYNAIEDDSFYNISAGGDGGNVRIGYSNEEYAKSERKRIAAVKKAHIHGELVKNSRLSRQDVEEIAERIIANDSLANIARDYGVIEMTISDIKNKRTWIDVVGRDDFSNYKIVYDGNARKPVAQYDLNMRKIASYRSARDASMQTGIGYKLISKVCRGERSSTHGFVFQFESKGEP